MKIKKIKINEQLVSTILSVAMTVGTIGGTVLYYQYDNSEQVCEIDMNSQNIFVNENGELSCYFDIGEHIITVSRNDAYYYKSEVIEGYTISEVEINGWRDNNKITYVNNKPVIVVATINNNGQLEFNNFGIVLTEKTESKIKKQNNFHYKI